MSTAAQTAANLANSQLSTGPRTGEGKDRASRNALTFGLFTQRDFVRPEETEEYEALGSGLRAELSPEGPLEQAFAASVVSAVWRLRRCGLVEAKLVERTSTDPMLDEQTARTQISVDRARVQAHTLLRRSVGELRRLKTDRAIHRELFFRQNPPPDPGLVSYKEVVATLNADQRGRQLVARHSLDRAVQVPQLASIC